MGFIKFVIGHARIEEWSISSCLSGINTLIHIGVEKEKGVPLIVSLYYLISSLHF